MQWCPHLDGSWRLFRRTGRRWNLLLLLLQVLVNVAQVGDLSMNGNLSLAAAATIAAAAATIADAVATIATTVDVATTLVVIAVPGFDTIYILCFQVFQEGKGWKGGQWLRWRQEGWGARSGGAGSSFRR